MFDLLGKKKRFEEAILARASNSERIFSDDHTFFVRNHFRDGVYRADGQLGKKVMYGKNEIDCEYLHEVLTAQLGKDRVGFEFVMTETELDIVKRLKNKVKVNDSYAFTLVSDALDGQMKVKTDKERKFVDLVAAINAVNVRVTKNMDVGDQVSAIVNDQFMKDCIVDIYSEDVMLNHNYTNTAIYALFKEVEQPLSHDNRTLINDLIDDRNIPLAAMIRISEGFSDIADCRMIYQQYHKELLGHGCVNKQLLDKVSAQVLENKWW